MRSAALAPAAGLLALALPAQEPVDFNRDVRPILSDRCFACHGFDARARKAELRLDSEEGLFRTREGRSPVVRGAPERSELVRRTSSRDPKVAMPPPHSGLSLSDDERALLRRWVAEGAPFAPHWAFVPPVAPPVPEVGGAQARNEIDRFVLARLQRAGLRLSPEADRACVLRRVSLDLTGLPPEPEEIDAFVADTAPDAYEKVVDRLLASPRFGERLALVWLDAARYADTNGFHHDNVRTAWPYRDWVIRAFNENMPFDRFALLQLAGDLGDEPTVQDRIATAFCRMHNINDEGGALDAEYRVEAVCDRIETVATVFLGLTLACARCHDHKYDPITQDDYYGLYAYFNSIDEKGVYPQDFEQARAYPPRVAYRTPELAQRIAGAQRALAAAQAALDAAAPAVVREREAAEETFRAARGIEWAKTELVEAVSAAGLAMTPLPDGSVRASGRPQSDVHTLTLRTDATGLRLLRFEALPDPSFTGGSTGLAENGNAVVTSITAEAIAQDDPTRREAIEWAWAWADHEQGNGDFDVLNVLADDARGWALEGHERREPRTALLLAARPFGFPGGTLVRVSIAYRSRYAGHVVGRPRLSLAAASGELRADFPLVASDWWLAGPFRGGAFETLCATRFGPEEGALDVEQRFADIGWQHLPALRDGEPYALTGERAVFYLARTLRTPVPCDLVLSLGSDDALHVLSNGAEVLARDERRGVAPDQERVTLALPAGESTLVLKIVNDAGPAAVYHAVTTRPGPPASAPAAFVPAGWRDEALAQRFHADWARAHSEAWVRLSEDVAARREELQRLEDEAVPVPVMQELDAPVPAFVLRRGRYDMADPSRPAVRRPPTLLGALPAGVPNDRLGFARWLTRDDHPLTARVHVNRLWQMLFGTGLVASSENFGQQADLASHPALLDWLAVRFVASGWDQKALLRLIVTSATYRQGSAIPAAAKAIDPQNRLLASFPRRRLPAELIRDQALFVAGLLRERLGGPSVKPYQPPGLWREVSIGGNSNTQVFARDDGDALWRRSIYTFWKRTSPSPQMAAFDAPTREFCVVRRSTTSTPLQVLVLWNDEQLVEAARCLAQRTLAEADETDARIARMFRRCTGRQPSPDEHAILRRTLHGFERRYEKARDDANRLLRQGEAPLPRAYDAAELASWTMLGTALLSLDATIVRS